MSRPRRSDRTRADPPGRAGPPYRYVIFDLDGTLSDSAPGILGALRHAFAVNGLPPLAPQTERSLLGPPFYDSLPPLIGGVQRLPGVLAAYREHYSAGGMFQTTAYRGVPELLGRLRAEGTVLAVATSKPEHHAVPIIEHLGLADAFVTVGGDTLDGARRTKALVLGEVLARLGAPDPADVVMIGDRSHDAVGAAEHGIRCAGAGWGYGAASELAAAGADPILARPAELAGWLCPAPGAPPS